MAKKSIKEHWNDAHKSTKELAKEQIKDGKVAIIVSIIGIIVSVFAISMDYFTSVYRDSHPSYSYETVSDWYHLDELSTLLSNHEQIIVYDKGDNTEMGYINGASLVTLYTNFDKQDRVISKFNVHANNIVEDYTPRIGMWFSDEYEDILVAEVYNYGWGSSGQIEVNFLSIGEGDYNDNSNYPKIFLKETATHSFSIDGLEPGERRSIPLFSLDDFKIDWPEKTNSNICTGMNFCLKVENSAENYTIRCPFEILEDKVRPYPRYQGGPFSQTNFVVVVDTSEPTWNKSFNVFQNLPAGQTIRIPILIMPMQSCSMSVSIEFETLDGEVLSLTPLSDSDFFVNYYEGEKVFLDGSIIDWDNLNGTEIFYFPFKSINTVVNTQR